VRGVRLAVSSIGWPDAAVDRGHIDPLTRILVISNHYPPQHYGGYELACADAVRHWREWGHEVVVLTSDHRVREDLDEADVDVRRELPLTSRHGTVPRGLRRLTAERDAASTLARAVHDLRPDVLSVWNMGGLPMTLLWGVRATELPVVVLVADPWPATLSKGDSWTGPWAKRPRRARVVSALTKVPTDSPSLDVVGRFAFVSRALRDECIAGSPFRFPKSAIVPLGVDLEQFPLADPESPRPWRGDLLYVGRLDPGKGIDTAIRALRHLRSDHTLHVLGPAEPEHLARVQATMAEAGVAERVKLGSLPRAELAARYRSADVCLFPSEWNEPFGIVPLEAMASATPVVATGTGGAGDYMVDGENCLLFPAGDADGLAAAVRRLSEDARLHERLVAGGQTTAARLTITNTATLLDALLTEEIAQSSRPR
jgi:glycosyltransferase involved in cell wall biosynthesis